MCVIGHIVDGDQFLFLAGNDTRDKFLQFVIARGLNESLPAFCRENDVNVNLL